MKIDETLAAKFNLTIPEPTPVAPVPAAAVIVPTESTVEADVAKARSTISTLIDKGMKSLDTFIQVTDSTDQSPRAYEVLSTMLKTMSDLSKDLLELQKSHRDLQPDRGEETKSAKIQNQQNFFVGSTSELLQAMKGLEATARVIAPATVDADVEDVEHEIIES